jgi:hypothetical protein
MPPTNFLGDYGRQRQRAVIVDAGALTIALARQRAARWKHPRATVECADSARAFVFNAQSHWRYRNPGIVGFCRFRTAPTVLLSRLTA